MKVLLVDDHALFREGVTLLLRRLDAEMEAIAAGSCEDALAQIRAFGPPDLALVDLGLPGIDGMDGLHLLREEAPNMLLVVMSSDDDQGTILEAIRRGAVGFIPKSSTSETMNHALRVVLDRGIYLPPSVSLNSEHIGQAPSRRVVHTGVSGVASLATPRSLGLTPRQTDVLRLILLGKSAKLISRELDLSESTVKTHTGAVLRALNVTTRTQAVIAAARLGVRIA
ncbi:MAG: response regulator transcription factor [Proteobacteria bacterium]|nr:response regulator transcription factor [Pseudomonadota bacterium]